MRWKLYLLSVVLLCLQGAISAQNSQPVFSDDALAFSKAKNFWTEAEADGLVQAGTVGRTPATALVPLIFDRTGYLVTPETYNAAIEAGSAAWDRYVTDLQTFRKVMKKLVTSGSQGVARLETATVEYVGGIGYDAASAVFLYDPYQTFYETWEEIQAKMDAIPTNPIEKKGVRKPR